MLSIRVRNGKMSEPALNLLAEPAPSKLRVAGSNPAGVATAFFLVGFPTI
jgi:hypothetical protein